MITLQNVAVAYGETPVLQDVHFALPHGAFAFLRGRSGYGKSTFLKLLYRDVEAQSGELFIDGVPMQQLQKFELRRKMGIIFQSFELIEQKTVLENVLLAGKALGRPLVQITEEAERLLARVGLIDKLHMFPAQLSGGQQQRVAIVRALLNKPKLLLADEPTGNLDEETAADIFQLLYELHQEEQIAMLIVTHQSHEQIDATTYWMEGGRIVEQAATTLHR